MSDEPELKDWNTVDEAREWLHARGLSYGHNAMYGMCRHGGFSPKAVKLSATNARGAEWRISREALENLARNPEVEI